MSGGDRREHEVAEDAAAYLRDDAVLGPHVEGHGVLRLDPADDLFERLVRSILRQQVSTAAADAIESRLTDAVELTPGGILAAEESTLRDAGLSQQKTRYARAIAETFREEGYSKRHFAGATDDEIRDALTHITGVGPWTVDMMLMFAFGRPDVFPVGDLGIRRGMESMFGELTRGEMSEEAERWAPYRSYASLHLWRLHD